MNGPDSTTSKAPRLKGVRAPEVRTMMSAAKLGLPHSEEQKRKISEGLRRWYETPGAEIRGFRRELTDDERADLELLVSKGRYSRREALIAVGRSDLLSWRPTPKPPLSLYRKLTAEEKLAYARLWHLSGWREALTIVRPDLVEQQPAADA